MKVILFLICFLFLILRIIFYNQAKGKALNFTMFKLFGDAHSFNILIPLKYSESEDATIRKFKRVANIFLYLFLLFFIGLLAYGLFNEWLE